MPNTTRKSMLDAIKAGNEEAWAEFYAVYSPLIRYCGTKSYLQKDELEDLVQDVMLRIFKQQNTFVYDPSKGKFRTYLGRVINSSLVSIVKKRMDIQEIDEIPSNKNSVDDILKQEWTEYVKKHAFHILKERVSETTYQAFEMLSFQERSPQETALFLDISVQKVYEAKRRCSEMFEEIIKTLED